MNIIVNSDRTVEKEYTEKDGSQNENRVTELNFTLPEEYSGEGFVPKIAFITEDGNFSDYIDNGKYILKNNITKYREVICFVWLTNSVNNIDFRSQTFPLEFYYNEDPSDYIPSEQEKSQIELLMEELEEKIQEVTELEENVYTKDETYSKEEVDEIIPTDISDLNNDSGFIDKDVNNLTNYYKKSETYTKQEIDGKISSVYKYKGTVASYNNLPSTGLTIGDVYNVEDTGDNYAWTGTDWDKLGGNIDLSGYQEKIDNSHKLNADLVDDSNSINKFTSDTEKNSWNAKYDKPSGGIPSTDMSSNVQASLEKAETAIQDVSGKEDKSNKTGILDENSTDTQYPHAKAVYDNLLKKAEKYTTYKISITEKITSLTVYTVPFVYEVGNNSIVIFYNNEKLISENSETDLANYKEIGQIGSLSNKVKFGFDLEIGDILEFFVIEKEGNVYGVRRKITNNSSSTWERLFNSIGKNANATKNGDTVVNDFDSLAPWSEIKTCNYDLTTKKIKAWLGDVNFKFDGTNGDVFTYVPNTYWKIYQEDDYDYVLLADYPKSGFNEIDGFFIGRYTGSVVDSVLHSYSGLVPTTGRNISQFRTLARALGDNFSQLDWRYFVLQMLYLVEYADYNSQSKLGNGIMNRRNLTALVAETSVNRVIVSNSSGYYVGQIIRIGTSDGGTQVADARKITAIESYSENGVTGYALTFDGAAVNIAVGNYVCTMAQETGQCDSLGMKSGCLNNDGYHAVIYRGVENIFANIWQFVDGINIKDNVAYICKDHSEYVSDKFETPYKALGYTNINANGWAKTLGFDVNEPFFIFPTEVGGGLSNYMSDYYYQNSGNRVALVGGSFHNGADDGLWYWHFGNASSNADWRIGCRVLIDNQ